MYYDIFFLINFNKSLIVTQNILTCSSKGLSMESDLSPLCVELVVLLRLLTSSSIPLDLSVPLLLKLLFRFSVGEASYTDLSFLKVFGRSAGIGRRPMPSRVVVEPLNRPVTKKYNIFIYVVTQRTLNICDRCRFDF